MSRITAQRRSATWPSPAMLALPAHLRQRQRQPGLLARAAGGAALLAGVGLGGHPGPLRLGGEGPGTLDRPGDPVSHDASVSVSCAWGRCPSSPRRPSAWPRPPPRGRGRRRNAAGAWSREASEDEAQEACEDDDEEDDPGEVDEQAEREQGEAGEAGGVGRATLGAGGAEVGQERPHVTSIVCAPPLELGESLSPEARPGEPP